MSDCGFLNGLHITKSNARKDESESCYVDSATSPRFKTHRLSPSSTCKHLFCRCLPHARNGYDGGEYAYGTVITEPRHVRKALLRFLSLAVSHINGKGRWCQENSAGGSSVLERQRHGVLSCEDVCGLLHGVHEKHWITTNEGFYHVLLQSLLSLLLLLLLLLGSITATYNYIYYS